MSVMSSRLRAYARQLFEVQDSGVSGLGLVLGAISPDGRYSRTVGKLRF